MHSQNIQLVRQSEISDNWRSEKKSVPQTMLPNGEGEAYQLVSSPRWVATTLCNNLTKIDTAKRGEPPGHQMTPPSPRNRSSELRRARYFPVDGSWQRLRKRSAISVEKYGKGRVFTCGSVPNLDATHNQGSSSRKQPHARNVDNFCQSKGESPEADNGKRTASAIAPDPRDPGLTSMRKHTASSFLHSPPPGETADGVSYRYKDKPTTTYDRNRLVSASEVHARTSNLVIVNAQNLSKGVPSTEHIVEALNCVTDASSIIDEWKTSMSALSSDPEESRTHLASSSRNQLQVPSTPKSPPRKPPESLQRQDSGVDTSYRIKNELSMPYKIELALEFVLNDEGPTVKLDCDPSEYLPTARSGCLEELDVDVLETYGWEEINSERRPAPKSRVLTRMTERASVWFAYPSPLQICRPNVDPKGETMDQ